MTDEKEKVYREFVIRLQQQRARCTNSTKDILSDQLTFIMHHGVMGLVTEAAELMDLHKKHLVYNRPLDMEKIMDEAGDVLFYLMMIIIESGSNLDEIMDLNMSKLKARYPDGYSHKRANNRNVKHEEKVQQARINSRTCPFCKGQGGKLYYPYKSRDDFEKCKECNGTGRI